MSTIYTFHRECPALLTPATGDRIMIADVSDNATHPSANDITLALCMAAARGTATTQLLGFYGASPVDQGTFTATATTALTNNPTIAKSTTAGTYGFTTSTTPVRICNRIQQMQVDLNALMARVNSTGLVDVTGL